MEIGSRVLSTTVLCRVAWGSSAFWFLPRRLAVIPPLGGAALSHVFADPDLVVFELRYSVVFFDLVLLRFVLSGDYDIGKA